MDSIRTSSKDGIGSTTLVTSISAARVAVLAVCVAAAAAVSGCSVPAGHARERPEASSSASSPVRDAGAVWDGARQAAPASRKGKGPSASASDAGTKSALPVVSDGDCVAVCSKLLQCGHGPWDTEAECRDACEAAVEDNTSGKTYRCVAKATTCAKVKRCGR